MERGVGTFGESSRLLNIAPRIGTIVLAVILICVAAGTIGIISNNGILDPLRDAGRSALSTPYQELQDLTILSQGAAAWLIVLGIGVLVAETVVIILEIANVQTLKLVIQIIDIIFSVAVALSYGATGIACAAYAAGWGEPPEACGDSGDLCDQGGLTATNALSSVFSFIQSTAFGFIAFWVIYTLVKSRKA